MIKNGVWTAGALLALSLAASAGGADPKEQAAKPAARPGVKASLSPGDVKTPGDVARLAAKNTRLNAARCSAGPGGVCHVKITADDVCRDGPTPDNWIFNVKPGVTVFWTISGSARWSFDPARGIAFKRDAPVNGQLVSDKVWRGEVSPNAQLGYYDYGIHLKHADGRTCDVDPILWV